MKRNELALSFRLGSPGVDFEMRLVLGMFIRECSREHLWKEGRKQDWEKGNWDCRAVSLRPQLTPRSRGWDDSELLRGWEGLSPPHTTSPQGGCPPALSRGGQISGEADSWQHSRQSRRGWHITASTTQKGEESLSKNIIRIPAFEFNH